jgi:hypothetical protein
VDVIGLIAGSGWASGLNLYLVTLVLGLAGRLGWGDVPAVLTRNDVLIVAAILFFIEFAADKIPYLDNVWDALHTVIRPLGAAALGFVIAGESDSIGEALGALIAGGLALSSHSAKASTRAAANTTPEPVSNLTLSVFEDGMATGVTALALAFPGCSRHRRRRAHRGECVGGVAPVVRCASFAAAGVLPPQIQLRPGSDVVFQDADVREVAVLAGVVQSVTDDEFRSDLKSRVLDRQGSPLHS